MLIEMKIKSLMIDPINEMPIIVLMDIAGKKILPIWVGFFEANAIALKIENVPTPRPMTHDLYKNTVETLGAKVKKVEITKLEDSTYFANIHLLVKSKLVKIDSRPSDAIAIALRTDSPIFVDESVIESAAGFDLTGDPKNSERLKKWLENLDVDALGKYKM
jgi:bifunctional DNase/RNase